MNGATYRPKRGKNTPYTTVRCIGVIPAWVCAAHCLDFAERSRHTRPAFLLRFDSILVDP